ncbi:MAG: alpha/beta fold hydrolase [Haloarculaceae archaeon]
MPTLDTGDASLYYETHGAGDPLVFVHGGWVSSRMWAPQVERFADDYRVVTVDVRGHGRTGATDRRRYSIPLFAADLRAVLEHEDATDPAAVCGLSMGGHVAQLYAATYDLRRLVLAATTRTVPPIPMSRSQKLAFAPKPVVHALIRRMGVASYYESLLAGIRAIEGHRWVALDDDNRRYVREEIGRFDTREYIKVFDALYDHDALDHDALDAPTLLVHGDHESETVVRQNRAFEDALDATRVEIPDAGHLANLDNPAAFDAALGSFLAA